jgi:hypothetical protein
MYSFSEGIQNSSQRQRQAFIGSLITLVNRSFILKRMASIPHRSKRNKRQRNGDDDDDESFSAAFAEVRVPDDILQRRAVDQDQVEVHKYHRNSRLSVLWSFLDLPNCGLRALDRFFIRQQQIYCDHDTTTSEASNYPPCKHFHAYSTRRKRFVSRMRFEW